MYFDKEITENIRDVLRQIAISRGLAIKNIDDPDLFRVENLSRSGIMLELRQEGGSSAISSRMTVDALTKDANESEVAVVMHWSKDSEEDALITGVEIFSRADDGFPKFPIRTEDLEIF